MSLFSKILLKKLIVKLLEAFLDYQSKLVFMSCLTSESCILYQVFYEAITVKMFCFYHHLLLTGGEFGHFVKIDIEIFTSVINNIHKFIQIELIVFVLICTCNENSCFIDIDFQSQVLTHIHDIQYRYIPFLILIPIHENLLYLFPISVSSPDHSPYFLHLIQINLSFQCIVFVLIHAHQLGFLSST